MTRFSAMTAVLLVICVAQSAQPQESPAGGDPLKTITYALQLSRQSPGPEHVYAARGAYDNNHGEIFPLEIPRGTSLSSLEGPELTSIEIFSSDISRVPVIVIPLGEQRSVLSGFRIQGGAMGIIAYANDPQESAYRAVIENNIIEKNNYGFNYPAWTPPVMVNDGHVGVAVVAATERVVDVSVRYNRIQDNRFADLLWRARPGNLSTVMGNEISRSRHGIFYEDWETSTEEDGALLIASNVLYCCEVLCYLGGSAQAKLVHNTLAFAQSRPRFHDIAVGLWVGPRNLIAMTGNLFWNPTIDQITGVDVLIPVQTQDALAAFVAQFGRNAYQNGVWRNFVDPRLTNFANGVFPGSVDFVRTNYQTCDLDLHLVGWSAGVRKNSALIDQADAATIVPGGSEETETDVDGDPRISRYYGMDRPDFGADEVSVFSLSFGAGATPRTIRSSSSSPTARRPCSWPT